MKPGLKPRKWRRRTRKSNGPPVTVTTNQHGSRTANRWCRRMTSSAGPLPAC